MHCEPAKIDVAPQRKVCVICYASATCYQVSVPLRMCFLKENVLAGKPAVLGKRLGAFVLVVAQIYSPCSSLTMRGSVRTLEEGWLLVPQLLFKDLFAEQTEE